MRIIIDVGLSCGFSGKAQIGKEYVGNAGPIKKYDASKNFTS